MSLPKPKLRKNSTQIEIGFSLEVGVYAYTQNMKEVGGATQKHPASHKIKIDSKI